MDHPHQVEGVRRLAHLVPGESLPISFINCSEFQYFMAKTSSQYSISIRDRFVSVLFPLELSNIEHQINELIDSSETASVTVDL